MIVADLARYPGNVFIKGTTHVCIVAEYKGPLNIEATGYDVFGILPCELAGLIWLEFMLEQKLFVIYKIYLQFNGSIAGKIDGVPTGQLNDEWTLEDVLKPSILMSV